MLTVQFRSIRLKIHDLISGVKSMAEALKWKLYSLSDGEPIEYHIPEDFVDDLTSSFRGDSWIRYAHTVPREHALFRHMTSGGTCRLAEVKGGKLEWNTFACQEFMSTAASIVELIATLVHVGAGPPCRGTEQMEDQISNGLKLRTFYLNFGRLLTIRRHTKTTHASGFDAFNACFHPKILTDLIAYYLLVVRPLERAIAEVLYGPAAAENYDLYLYVKYGERMTSDQFSHALQEVTKEYLHVSLSLNPLRHILIAFQREYVEESRVPRGDNIGDLISAHSSRTADKVYAREHGLLEGMTSHHLLNVREWCEQYHDAIGLGEEGFPLIPLRTKRRHTRQLASVPHGNSDNGTIKSLLSAIQRTTLSSVIGQLQPFIREELRENFAESCTGILANIARDSIRQKPGLHPSQTAGATAQPAVAPAPHSTSIPLHHIPQPLVAPVTHNPLPTPRPSKEQVDKRKRALTQSDHGTSVANKKLRNDQSHSRISMKNRVPESDGEESPQRLRADSDSSMADLLQPSDQTATPEVDEPASQPPHLTNEVEQEVDALAESNLRQKPSGAISDLDMDSGTRPGTLETNHRTPSPPPSRPIDRQPSIQAAEGTRMPVQMTTNPSEVGINAVHQFLDQVSNPSQSIDEKALRGLRSVLKDDKAAFKSPEQQSLVESALRGQHTIAILPTGSGKSMAFEIPPVVEGRLTLVVVPFKAIMMQVLEGVAKKGIHVERWISTSTFDHSRTRLALIAVETATSAPFLK